MKTKHASIFSIIVSTLIELTLLTIGMCIGFSIPILFIFSVFYKFYSFNLSDAIFIIFGCIVYFLHLFRRMKNPQLFDMSKELRERSYQEISYFGMSFGFSAIVISFVLSFIRFLGVKTINPDEKSIIF